MIFRGATKNDDWVFGSGEANYLTGDAAIAKDLETRLRGYTTECFYDADFGFPWFAYLGQKTVEPLLLALQAYILETEGVVRITDLSLTRNEDRSITVNYAVDTIYSAGLSGSVTV